MTLLLRRRIDLIRRDPSGRDLLVAAGVAVLVVGAAGAVLGKGGVLVAGLAVGALATLVALVVPSVGLLLVVLAAFFRTALKGVLPADALAPALAVMIVAVVVAIARRTVARPRVGAVEWLMLAFLAWNLLSAALPHEYEALVPITGAPFDLERWFLSAIVLPFAVYQAARVVLADDRRLRWLLWTVVGLTAASTWLSIAQFHAPALTWPSYVVDSPNWAGRANGIFNQPVVNGGVLVVGLVVCLFLASRPETARNTRIGLYVLVAATTYAVYLTHTRAAVLGLAAAVVLGAVLARGWRHGFVVIGVLGVAGLASQASTLFSPDRSEGGFGSPSELYDRLNVAATALHAIADHPVAGIGVGRFGMYNTYEHQAWSDAIDWSRGQVIIAHQNDLGIGAEVGLPGLALWVAIVVCLAVLLWRARRALPGGGALGVVGLIALGVMLVNGFTVDLRPLEFTTILPFVLVGAVVGRFERHHDTPDASDAPEADDTHDTDDTEPAEAPDADGGSPEGMPATTAARSSDPVDRAGEGTRVTPSRDGGDVPSRDSSDAPVRTNGRVRTLDGGDR